MTHTERGWTLVNKEKATKGNLMAHRRNCGNGKCLFILFFPTRKEAKKGMEHNEKVVRARLTWGEK